MISLSDLFLPRPKEAQPHSELIMEATCRLSDPPDDGYYFSHIGSDEAVALAAFKCLARLRRPAAVDYLRRYMANENGLGMPELDSAFSELGYAEFVPKLREWLEEDPPMKIAVRILAALANADSVDTSRAGQIAKAVSMGNARWELMPTVARVFGRFGEDPENWLLGWIDPSNPVLCEAAIFALGRTRGRACAEVLSQLLAADSETVVSAAIEMLAKVEGLDSYDQIRRFSEHPSILVQSAFYRALRYVGPADWRSFIPIAAEQHPLVRVCATRSFAVLAEPDLLEHWLDDPTGQSAAQGGGG